MRPTHNRANSHRSHDANNANATKNPGKQNGFMKRSKTSLLALLVVGVLASGLAWARPDLAKKAFRGPLSSVGRRIFYPQQRPLAPTANSCVSSASGNWNDSTKWTGCGGTFPGATDDAFISTGHTISLTAAQSVNDLHVNTTGVLSIGANTLSVNGKVRAFTGVAPGTSSTAVAANNITSTGAGKLSFVGNTRAVTVSGEWGATLTGAAFEFALNSGQTATPGTNMKAKSWVFASGTVDASTTARTFSADDGTTGGAITIQSGAILLSSSNPVVQRTGTTSAASLTVNSGGTLVLTATSPTIAATTINFNGTVEYSRAGAQTFAAAVQSGADPTTYTNIKLSGSGTKTTLASKTTTINANGSLEMSGGATPPTFVVGASGTFSVNTTGTTILYTATAAQTTGAEWVSSFLNATINNAAGVSLGAAKTTNGTLTLTNGALNNGTNNIALGSGATVSRDTGSVSAAPTFGTSVNVTYTGTTSISTGPELTTSSTALNNLTINKSNGITLSSSPTVNGTLTFTSGNVTTNANTMIVGGAGSVTRTSGHVIGNLQRTFAAASSLTFDVGTANGYSPMAVNATAGTFPANFTVKAIEGAMPGISGANKLARYWTLTSPGSITANLTFNYLAGDVAGSFASYQFIKKSGGTLSTLAPTGTPTNTQATINGASSFSDWTLAEAAAVQSGSLQFSAANYNDSETNVDHTATITVTRTGGSDGDVSVTYATSNGTATTADNDYVSITNTLTWLAGDSTNKTFTVTVKGDSNYEADETVNLTLSLPTGGATLGSPNPATLTITNDDAAPATLVVTKTADTNGTCVIGNCSLREAINAANSNLVDANTINFNIPGTDPGLTGGVYVITTTSALPAISGDLTTIDGASQTTFGGNTNANGPEVQIDGGPLTAPPSTFVDGLVLTGGNTTVKGLIISGFKTPNFANRGILISSSNNTIQGNYIGTNAFGTAAAPNGDGIMINNGAANNIIGGTAAGQGNLISGNSLRGLVIQAGTTDTTVRGNLVGTNAAGTAAVANGNAGIEISGGSQMNTVGSALAGSRNIISGNLADGIKIDGASTNSNLVQGNYIGTDITGTVAFGNAGAGVRISSGGINNSVGGLTAGTRNVISANGSGVLITGSGTTSSHVLGNYIGTDVTGMLAIGNLEAGVDISGGATNNNVGDGTASGLNVISGNSGALGTPAGVLIREAGTSDNTVQGNYIGVAADGTSALGNTGGGAGGSQGVMISSGAANNIIGGVTAGEGNIIANNSGDGVQVTDAAASLGSTAGNSIRGNSIYGNTLLGINLMKNAEGAGVVTANDVQDTDNGPNGLQNFPIITTAVAGSTTVSGTLNSTPTAAFTIDVYSNASCDSSGNGEGATYLGSVTTGNTNGSGDVNWSVTVPALVNGQILTATATSTGVNGNTSEFSACFAAAAACTPPSTVYVDDSWVGTPLGTDPDMGGPATNFGCDSFATIQDGVNGVTAGGTVIVNAGNYVENVTIPKALTLTGAGAASVFLYPAISDPNCGGAGGASLCAGSSNLILVQANNVTISGLTLDGDNTSLPGGINVGGANVDARNGIITNHLAGVFNNLEVHHTTVKNIFLRGIYASSSGSFNFHDNTVHNVQGNTGSIGMFNFGGAGAFTNNNVSLCNDAISANNSRGTTFTGNTVTTSASGIHTDNAGSGGGTNDSISGNTVTNSSVNGFGIWTFVPALPVTVSNNTVTNVDVGLSSAGGINSPVASTFTGNTVDGQNKVNSTGVYLTTDQFGFGQGNNLVEFKTNTVINNVDGFYLEAKDSAGNAPISANDRQPVAVNVTEPGYPVTRYKPAAPEVALTLTVNASFNRIVNNTNTSVTHGNNLGTLAGTFENNWWGCNAGPNNVGCGFVVGTGVDFDPWIVLGISASPATIPPGGSSTITADMTHNSANAVPSVTDFVPQVAVTFGATNGTVFPTSGTITNGQATTTFTSNSTSSGTASATVDNQTVNTPVNVTAANTYTWSPTVGTDWINPLNWTPARILPQTNDNLVINGTTTPAPIITSVPSQTIAGLYLINAPIATLQSSGAATLTISGATGADLIVPAGSFLTLDGPNALSIKLTGAGTLGTVGGGVAAQGGFHRLFGDTNGDITIQSGGIATAGSGLTTNMFGTGAVGDGAAGSVIFANGSSYFHNAGGSPFGTSPNPAVAVFQTGSLATFLTASGFEANGRTYADLTIGKADPGGIAVTASDSGAGNFQFDNLTLNSTSSATSSLSYTGSGACTITIRGNISSTGAGNTGTLPDVTLTAGTGGTHVDKIGGGTLILNTTGNARSIDLEGGATVENGTTLSLARVVLLGMSNPHLNTLTVNATAGITGGSNGYVVGSVKKLALSGSFSFPVGTVGAYSPVDLANASGGDLTVVARTPQQPVLNAATSLQRYWTLTEGGTLTTDLTFHYLDGDVAGNEGNYRIVVVEAGNATSFPADANHSVNAGANTFTALGVQSFSDWTVAEPNAPTAVQLASFNAIRTGNEVMVQWRSGYEARNLGYNIYREQNGVRARITPSLVAGSALTAGMQTEARAGFTYTWYDELAKGKGHSAESSQNGNVTYWLEDVDLNGVKTLHGPIAPSIAYASPKGSRTARSDMISEVNASSSQARGSGVFYNGWVSDRPPLSASVANPNAIAIQRAVEMKGGIKISIKKDGWYRITQPQLLAAGLDPNANMPQLELYANGRAVPIRQSGDEVHLTPTDYIEFYARGVTSPTDAAQTYYLVLADTFGLRIHDLEYRNPDPLPAPSGPTGFDYTVERQERMIYFSSLQNGDLENFFGQIVSGAAASSTLPVTNLDPAAVQAGTPAQLEVTLQGVTNEAHQVKVKLNGTEVGTINFANTGHPVETFDIAPGMLLNGNNTVELSSQNGASDVSLVDTLRLTYTHTFTAENNLLSLNMADESVKRVGGFTSDNIRVLDITDPQRVEEITRTVAVNPEAGGSTYSVDMRVLGASFRQPHTLLAFTADGEAPAAVARNNASDLWNQNAGADYVMITTGALKDSIEPLAQFRRSQGLVVNVVDVEDLYDEFSFGLHTPQAIRDYLQGAMTNWTRKPRYVLFAGDASYDPKNYFNLGMNDLVPTKLIDTSLSETASDDWLVDFDNDGLADISIGRLPVRTVASANVIVSKIISYENSGPDPARGAMLVSDTSFVTASGTIQSLLPNDLPVENINRGTSDDATIHNQIVASLNQGPRVANYFGHGSHGVWTGASLLSSNDAPSLTNTSHLTVFTMMTCLNGIFQDAVNESLSEALLKSQGGAVAVWASSGFTEPAGQITIDQEFYRLIFAAQPSTLGDASRAAKATTSDADVRRTWTLFGDPAMKIK